jgi:hypothetical protein
LTLLLLLKASPSPATYLRFVEILLFGSPTKEIPDNGLEQRWEGDESLERQDKGDESQEVDRSVERGDIDLLGVLTVVEWLVSLKTF